jgi:AcrR family transcriptional regulator
VPAPASAASAEIATSTDGSIASADATTPAGSGTEPTRERILRVASEMFTRRGYFGTSTRDIATEVGVRQPSLFHHFTSKAAIADELLTAGLMPPVRVITSINELDGPVAPRLFAYIQWAVVFLRTLPFDAVGIIRDDVINTDEFVAWKAQRDALNAGVSSLAAKGVEDGEFVVLDVQMIRDLVMSVLNAHMLTPANKHVTVDLAIESDRAASFMLRGLLVDTNQLESVREAAAAIDAERFAYPTS